MGQMREVRNLRGFARRRRVTAAVGILCAVGMAVWVAGALADAGNPVLNTIRADVNDNGDGTVTIYVRGQWNWLSHSKDCNVDRNGTGVGIIWNDRTEPGYTVTKGSLSAGVGISSLRSGDTVNTIDQMVHPSDRGNLATETDANAPQPGPAGQSFVDPSPPSPASFGSWRSGCGRVPISTVCGGDAVGDPCGSWGYEPDLNDGIGQGYKHTYLKSALPDKVCVNFYDVHGSKAGFQAPNGAKEITVNGNGDNSIQTNAFNVNDGANCISFFSPAITTQVQKGNSSGASFTNCSSPCTLRPAADSFRDTAAVTSGKPNTSMTLEFTTYPTLQDCIDGTNGTARGTSTKTLSSSGGATLFTSDVIGGSASPAAEGDYFFRAHFEGSSLNLSADSACNSTNEKVTVAKGAAPVATATKVAITDFARVTANNNTTPTGNVTFSLYDGAFNAACTASSGQLVFGPVTKNLTTDGTGTGNARTVSVTTPDLTTTGISTTRTFFWLVEYGGDSNNNPSKSCTESVNIAGNVPGVDP
jgi:hypothetical protein